MVFLFIAASDPTTRGTAYNPTATLHGARHCLPSSQEERGPHCLLCSLSALANWLLSSTTAHPCMRNTAVSWGEASAGGNTGLRCLLSPVTHFLSHAAIQGCLCFASTIRWAAGNTLLLSKASPQETPAFTEEARGCRLGCHIQAPFSPRHYTEF